MQVSPYHHHWFLHPNVYVAPKINSPFLIDGNLEKDEWTSVPFSDPFDDIRGQDDAPPPSRPTPACRTRVKMLWDDEYLYIGAMLESDMEVRAVYQERNSPIYHEDSDFEVFLNPDSSCHSYKELEMNAINTVWNLMLDKPYADGGQEYSGRIAKPGDENYYDVINQNTAVRIVEGSINEEGIHRTVWTVEIALSHSDTLNTLIKNVSTKPKEGDQWRINFSRVEKKGDINWTWQKQRVWDPERHQFIGKVDMHMPDAWGYVRFGPSIEESRKNSLWIGEIPNERIAAGNSDAVDPNWPPLLAVMNIYYAQSAYLNLHGKYANNLEELNKFSDQQILQPFTGAIDLSTDTSGTAYKVELNESETGDRTTVTVDNTRMITITSQLDQKELPYQGVTKIK